MPAERSASFFLGALCAVALLFHLPLRVSAAGALPRCDADGKIRVAQTQLDSAIRKFVWLNSSNGDVEAIFILTSGRSVYRSTDEGKTFERLDSYLTPPILDLQTTANSKQLYFVGRQGKLWTTDDQGEHYKPNPADLYFMSVKPHPTNSAWALAQVAAPGCAGARTVCTYDLYLTQDFGVSWEKKSSYVADDQYDWGSAGIDNVPVGNVFFINFPNAVGDQRLLSRYYQVFQRTTDLFKTTSSQREHSLAFRFYSKTVLLAQLTPGNTPEDAVLKLYASTDDGATFNTCKFPTSLKEYSYTIIDISEGAAFVGVDHGGGKWATTYVSDSTLNRFSVSLNYTKRGGSGRVDFKRIKSLEGIYIANRYLINDDEEVNDDTHAGTVISFDKGGQWEKLSPPDRDLNGNRPCEGCSLNLIGFRTSNRGNKAFYSKTDTPGILLATGSVSPWLLDRADEINTYISVDAGMRWTEVAKGEHTYEMGDYGSLILLSKTYEATNTILYSWDQGLSVNECNLSTVPMEVQEIYTSPSGKDTSFLVYGTVNRKTYIVHVDFQNSATRTCDPTADYEQWSPSDAKDDRCILGQRIVYTRRKRDSKCYNPTDYERPVSTSRVCACKREDFQCDYCYEPDANNPDKCILSDDCNEDPSAPPVPCEKTWVRTKGYRLVPGDKCNADGSDSEYSTYAPVVTDCNDKGDGGHGGGKGLGGGAIFGILVAVFFAVGGLCALVGYALYRVNPEFREFVKANTPSPSSLFNLGDKAYKGTGSHEYSSLNSAEPQSLLDDLEGDDNAGLDDDLEDEPPELDDKSISSFTNEKPSTQKGDPLSGEGEDSFI